jgi:DNA-binding CsgD family transcriptional regulator
VACRDLGHDGGAWWNHYVSGLRALVGADTARGEEALAGPPTADGSPEYSNLGGAAMSGWDGGFDIRYFHQLYNEVLRHGPSFMPQYPAYFRRWAKDDGICLTSSELVRDIEYQRTECYHLQRGAGLDSPLYCVRSLSGWPGEVCVVNVCRSFGSPDFTARQKAIVQEIHATMTAMVGGPLARFSESSPTELPPRVRRVLRCMLEGDSDKQIVARLGITRHTVNQYAKAIHRHFGVTTRAELLARWVKRGWSSKFAWAADS